MTNTNEPIMKFPIHFSYFYSFLNSHLNAVQLDKYTSVKGYEK